MRLADLQKLQIPNEPGVYMFVGPQKEILYIGKATFLRSRIRSYFDKDILDTRGPHIELMVEQAKTVTWEKTDSVLEALIKEAYLIKTHTPRFNTKEKDDKSFNYVVVTEEEFSRILLVRGKELFGKKKKPYSIKEVFGPFPSGGSLRKALKIIRKIFPYRDTCTPNTGKPCFNRQISLCPGVCTGEISQREYKKELRNIILFFQGNKKKVVSNLKREMLAASKKLDFEKAQSIKHTLFALDHIQDVALMKDDSLRTPYGFRVESYDIAHISGTSMVGVMTVVENGEPKKDAYRKFKIRHTQGIHDIKSLTEILERRLGHSEWTYPNLIVVDGGKAQKNAAEKVLKTYGYEIPVVSVVKNEKHKPKDILGEKKYKVKYEKDILLANHEAHRFAISYHRSIRGNI